MVTLAPERPGAISFLEKLTEQGVVVAIGHTAATEAELDQAVRAGAKLSTHLGNGSQTMLPRHPNYIWTQLADDRLWATFIPDGHHLSPSVLKAMTRAKREKTIFVSDCTQFGGMAPGRYQSLIGGFARYGDRLCASLYGYMKLPEAVEAATLRPAQVMGLSSLGRIEIGRPAHLTLFRCDQDHEGAVTVIETVVSGKMVFRQPR